MPKYKHGSGSIYRRGKVWWLKYYVNKQSVYESAETTDRTEARRRLQAKVGQMAEGRYVGPAVERITFDELAHDLITDYENNGRKSLRELKIRLNKHLLPFFSGRKAHQIKTTDVEEYKRRRLAEQASHAAINRELAAVKRAFTLGLRAEKITKKPYIALLEEDNVRQGFFEPWQFEQVLAKLPEPLRPPVTFAYYTGWRIHSEIFPFS